MKINIFVVSLVVLSVKVNSFHIVTSHVNRGDRKLFLEFEEKHKLDYSHVCKPTRYKLFLASLQFVRRANRRTDDSATYRINFFSALTQAEQALYRGFNATHYRSQNRPKPPKTVRNEDLPHEKLWMLEGAVTPVKDMGKKCFSCWAFAAADTLETGYFVETGVLRDFSAQNFLDCVYQDGSGCNDGAVTHAFDYIETNQKLAASKNYTYTGEVANCKWDNSDPGNSLIAFNGGEYYTINPTDAAHTECLNKDGPITVGFVVTNHFQHYSSGILKDVDKECEGREPDHLMTAVGYTATYFVLKNMWGDEWGEKGFLKVPRGLGECGLFSESIQPSFLRTGVADDTPSDAASDYDPRKTDFCNENRKRLCDKWGCRITI